MDAPCLLLSFTAYLDALMGYTLFAFLVGAVILRGRQRYNYAGTAVLVGLIWGFTKL